MSETNTGISGRNAFKIGCMATLGIFAACLLAFCALPAACVMGTAGIGAASMDPVVTPAALEGGNTMPGLMDPADLVETPVATPAVVATATPVVTATPAPTADLSRFYRVAREKQQAEAARIAQHYKYYSDEADKYRRHNKRKELNEATAKALELKQTYEATVSEAYFNTLVGNEMKREAIRAEKAARDAELAPVRAKAKRDAEYWNAYSKEFRKHRD